MSRDRRLGWLLVLAGAALALGVQVGAPVGVPLFDGVVTVEPYRYLHPVADQAGAPTTFTDTPPVSGNESPVFAAYTDESPPQAQLIAQNDAFTLPQGTTGLNVSITPVDPVAPPTNGTIAGNVYRFEVADQAGRPLTPKTCDSCRSLVLRAPEAVTEGSIQWFDGSTWKDVATFHAGIVAMYQANLDALGDYAVMTGASAGSAGGIDPLLFGGIALVAFFAVVAGLFWYRRRPPPVPVARLGPGRGRVPSKRRGPRRPPTGRS